MVIGYFNFTRLDKTPGYREFYKAAIQSLERDPNRELVFAIVTSASSSILNHGIYRFPSASLLMWNESLVSAQRAKPRPALGNKIILKHSELSGRQGMDLREHLELDQQFYPSAVSLVTTSWCQSAYSRPVSTRGASLISLHTAESTSYGKLQLQSGTLRHKFLLFCSS